jgi:hypothetical protein
MFLRKNFFSVQIGTGFNTQTIGKDFYTYQGSSTDFLGFDNGFRDCLKTCQPNQYLINWIMGEKTAFGKEFRNIWTTEKQPSTIMHELNSNFLINGGFNKKLSGQNKLAGSLR